MKQAEGLCVKCNDGILKPIIGKRDKALCSSKHYWESKRKPIVAKPTQLKRSPIKKNKDYVIPKVTKKQAQRNAQYLKQRGPYLLANPYCVIRMDECTGVAEEVHHGAGRIGGDLLDESTWRSACKLCHHWVEMNPESAKELGHSLIRTK